MTFVVKFLDLEETTKQEFEYTRLIDALKVVQETPIDGVFMSNVKFERELIHLLTSTFMYAGKQSKDFPEGNVMIMLLECIDGPGNKRSERAVYPPHIVPFVAGSTPPVAKNLIPSQPKWDPVREKQTLLKMDTNPYATVKPISPVAETISGDQNPETD